MNRSAVGTVLVTGAGGFVGRALVPGLAAAGWRVRAASRVLSADPAPAGVEFVRLPDLAASVDWPPLLDGVSHIVHLAGIAHTRAPLLDSTYMRINAEAAGDLARAASAAGVSRLVLMSSVRAQTGASAAGHLNETTNPAPTDAYGRSKLAAEQAVAAAIPSAWTALRPVLVMGPGVKGNLAALANLAKSPLPLPFGALTNRRSLLGLANLVSIVQFTLTAPAAESRVFLAADPDPLSVTELLVAMRRAINRPARLVPVPPALLRLLLTATGRGGLAQSLLGDLDVDTRALSAAGWQPVVSTAAEIVRMMSHVLRPPTRPA